MFRTTLAPEILGCAFVVGFPSFSVIARKPDSTCGMRLFPVSAECGSVVLIETVELEGRAIACGYVALFSGVH